MWKWLCSIYIFLRLRKCEVVHKFHKLIFVCLFFARGVPKRLSGQHNEITFRGSLLKVLCEKFREFCTGTGFWVHHWLSILIEGKTSGEPEVGCRLDLEAGLGILFAKVTAVVMFQNLLRSRRNFSGIKAIKWRISLISKLRWNMRTSRQG